MPTSVTNRPTTTRAGDDPLPGPPGGTTVNVHSSIQPQLQDFIEHLGHELAQLHATAQAFDQLQAILLQRDDAQLPVAIGGVSQLIDESHRNREIRQRITQELATSFAAEPDEMTLSIVMQHCDHDSRVVLDRLQQSLQAAAAAVMSKQIRITALLHTSLEIVDGTLDAVTGSQVSGYSATGAVLRARGHALLQTEC